MSNKKTLQQKFLDGDKLNLLDNLRMNLLQRLSECDGMCGFYQICGYCEVYKNMPASTKQKYRIN
jgi:hypothetical protein